MKRVYMVVLLLGISQALFWGCHHTLRKARLGERCRKKSDCKKKHTCWKGRCYKGQCLQSSDCPNGWLGCFYKIRQCGKDIAHMQRMRWGYHEYPFPKGFVPDRRMLIIFPASRPQKRQRNGDHKKARLRESTLSYKRNSIPTSQSKQRKQYRKRHAMHRVRKHIRKRKRHLNAVNWKKVILHKQFYLGVDFLMSFSNNISFNPNIDFILFLWKIGLFQFGFPVRLGYFAELLQHNILVTLFSFVARYELFPSLFIDSIFRYSYGLPIAPRSGHLVRFDVELGLGARFRGLGFVKLYAGIAFEHNSSYIVYFGSTRFLFYPVFFSGLTTSFSIF